MNFYIFNFRWLRSHTFPRAFFVTILVLLSVEGCLRVPEPQHLISGYLNSALRELYTVIDCIDLLGPADVCFVGSSRTREGILMPEVQEVLIENNFDNLSVANYACSGIVADEVNAIIKCLLQSQKKPKIVLYGLSPRQLWGYQSRLEHASLFWNTSDWWINKNQTGGLMWKHLPRVMKNTIRQYCWTFRFRGTLAQRIMTPFDQPIPSPMKGELSFNHTHSPDRSLLTDPISEQQIQTYINRLVVKAHRPFYPIGDNRIAKLMDLIEYCQDLGVKLVIFEIPLPTILWQHLPPGLHNEFVEKIETIVKKSEVTWVSIESLSVGFSDAHFREQSHLNYAGAQVLTHALMKNVVIPLLSRKYALKTEGIAPKTSNLN